jgi:hypothetical protein
MNASANDIFKNYYGKNCDKVMKSIPIKKEKLKSEFRKNIQMQILRNLTSK